MTTVMKHPFHTHHTVIGYSYEKLYEFVRDISLEVSNKAWTRCTIGGSSFPSDKACAFIELNSGPGSRLLGEIGLSYICYRLRDIVDRTDVLALYRSGSYGALSGLLQKGLEKLAIHYDMPRHLYTFIILDGELMSILTQYKAVPNYELIHMIDNAHLNKRVVWWRWRPTELRIRIQGGIFAKRFKYGTRIRNGETGHAALSYHSILWTDSANGVTHTFSTPYHEKGYARHMPTVRLNATLASLSDTLKENAIVEAFEQMASIPGKWGLEFFDRNWGLTKGREITKEKVQVAFEDDVDLYYEEAAHTTQDLVALLLDTGAKINKSAALIVNQMVTLMINEILLLRVKATGEVITQ